MKDLKISLNLCCLFIIVIGAILSPALALDPNSHIRDRYSSPSKGRQLSPPSPASTTKQPPTLEQRVDYLTAKIATLEQTVNILQTQVTAQAQQLNQLAQVISVNSSGTVTIQAPNVLNLSAGSTLNLSSSLIDMKAGLTGVHGVLKADTMITNTITSSTYTPGAGNIW